jgi:hypothetical protein
MNQFMSQAQSGLGNLDRGTTTTGAQAVIIDSSNFLLLSGRSPRQAVVGVVEMEMDDQRVAQNLTVPVGLTLVGISSTDPTKKHKAYFNTLNIGSTDFVSRWTFPILAASPQDSTFVAESGSQSLALKRLVSGTIQVGTSAGRCLFEDAGSGARSFFIQPNTGFPLPGVSQPTLYIPSLDTTADTHTIVFIHSNASAPFPAGSVIYGNAAGTEMVALANGAAGQVLTSGGTTVAPSWQTPSAGGGSTSIARTLLLMGAS